jgi:hypothetical protein
MTPRKHAVLVASCMWLCAAGLADTAEQARAAVYVVDSAAPGAADANPGSEEKPFKTIQHAADTAQPGDNIYVMAGHYDTRVKIKTSGTQDKPITFQSMPRHSAIVAGFDLGASYIHIGGFEITADKPVVAVQITGSNNEVTDNYIHEMMEGVSGKGRGVSHNHVAYNKVYHSEYGFVLNGNDWLLENNEVNRLFMYMPGNKNDDCDYTRFFGKGCTEQYNYYHGTTQAEIKVAHTDCIQTFGGGGAQDFVFQYNTCFDFHQGCMVESKPNIGSVKNWTFRGNIYCTNSPTMRGGWGPDICQAVDVTIENNTIWTVNWSAIGLRGKESTGGQIRNNILGDAQRAVVDGDSDFTPSNPVVEYNLTFKTRALAGDKNINKDPLFVDAAKRNFRLQKGTPAAGAGKDGVTIGALEYPNVYYVDPRHPAAADEPAWGYPGVPLATLAKACEVAAPGETILLRGGIYRELFKPAAGVKVRVMKGETVIITGADLIEGWKHETNGAWSASLPAEPKKILRDNQPFSDFTYDKATKQITLKSGGDPRLHLFEILVRDHGIEPAGNNNANIEGITVVNTLQEAK